MAFGRLADEYIVYDTTIPNEEKENLLLWQEYNYNLNISPYYTKEQVPWSRFIGKPEYPHVDVFEGGITTPKVLRVRKTSVVWMITDRTSTHKAGI